MRRRQGIGDLHGDRDRVVERQRPPKEPIRQGLPSTSSITRKMVSAGLLHPLERGDVRVVERREDLGFALEPRDAIGVRREHVEDDLDRHSRPSLLSRAR